MSERSHKQAQRELRLARLIYLQSEGEYGEPPRKRPIPPRTIGKAPHIRLAADGEPNRTQRRAAMGRNPEEVALQRLLFEKRRSIAGVAAMNAAKKRIADGRREYVAKTLASWHEAMERNERFRTDFSAQP